MGFAMQRVVTNQVNEYLTELHPKVVRVMEKAKSYGIEIHLPVDYITHSRVGDYTDATVPPVHNSEMDCGPVTQAFNTTIIKASKTIIWNGPIGVYEKEQFEGGTTCMMRDVINATKLGASSLIIGKHMNRFLDLHNFGFAVTHKNKWSSPSFKLLFGIPLEAISGASVAATGMHISTICISNPCLSSSLLMQINQSINQLFWLCIRIGHLH